MENVEPQIWITSTKDIPKGKIELYRIISKILSNSRRIWIYIPYGYDGNKIDNVIVLTDGFDHINILNAKNVLDNLIHNEKIPKSICVFIDTSIDRFKELTCNEIFSKFIEKELMPWIHESYNVNAHPKNTIIGGISLGGLFAAYLGLKHPNIFGNILAQSGSFWWNDEWLIEEYKKSGLLPLKFYLNVGFLENKPYDDEPIMKDCVDKMRYVLLSKGYNVSYEEFPSGHDYLCWGEKLATGLIALISKEKIQVL